MKVHQYFIEVNITRESTHIITQFISPETIIYHGVYGVYCQSMGLVLPIAIKAHTYKLIIHVLYTIWYIILIANLPMSFFIADRVASDLTTPGGTRDVLIVKVCLL